MTREIKISEEDSRLLKTLIRRVDMGKTWSRPMDLGAWDGSSHSAKLKRLAEKGQVQRERRSSICNDIVRSARGSYEYTITEAGRKAVQPKG